MKLYFEVQDVDRKGLCLLAAALATSNPESP